MRRVEGDGQAPAGQEALLELIPKAESLSAQKEDHAIAQVSAQCEEALRQEIRQSVGADQISLRGEW